MLPDRVSNPGPLNYESGALPIALRGPFINVIMCPKEAERMANSRSRPDCCCKSSHLDVCCLIRCLFPILRIFMVHQYEFQILHLN